MKDATKEQVLSLDAKLIAASNLAVAKALWSTYQAQQAGQSAMSADKLVSRDFKNAVKEVEAMVAEIKIETPPVELKPIS